VAAVLGATGGERVDVLIDTAGGPALPALVTGAVAPGGRAVLVGYAAGTEATFVLPALLAADVRLIPMNLIRWEQRLRGVAAELLERLGRGELELARTVLPLERVGEAVASLRAGTAVGRVVVTNEGSR
jgi:NADPH:quinone reductase-like Zn-dependent oxidoreductase